MKKRFAVSIERPVSRVEEVFIEVHASSHEAAKAAARAVLKAASMGFGKETLEDMFSRATPKDDSTEFGKASVGEASEIVDLEQQAAE